ncbi:MAG: LacI family DNA-binding transcriptional regulator [Oscillospiraceae bacterium]|nr:LacI family DNA-binding transcriptional regulator [Oscillospiraceae bacterium]
MKKSIAKLLALALVLSLILTVFAGCKKAKSEDDITIGVVIWSTDDGLGADSKAALDAAANALGIKLVYRTGSYDAENQMTDFENLIASGVDGILVTTLVDTSTDELLKICEEAGIPMQLMFRNIIDKEAYNYCMASSKFSGYVVESEEGAGSAMVDKLVEMGCKSIGLMFREAGNGVIDRRQAGVLARLEELGIEYHTTTITNTATATDMTDAAAQLIGAYSNIDGMICSSGSAGTIDGLITYLEGTDIKLTSFDTPADLKGSFEAGNLVMLTTGAQIDPMYALICIYRQIKGNPFSSTPVEIGSNYIYLEKAEDIATYDTYFSTFKTYTSDEIVKLTEMSYDEFVKEVSSYSLETVANKNK